MTGLFLVVALFVCLLLGVPIAVSLGFASVITLMLFSDQTLLSLSQRFFHTMQVYPLLAIPFFILAGTLMTSGGVARRMIAFADALVGHMHGGLRCWPVCCSLPFPAPRRPPWWPLARLSLPAW
jgi:C4-dicarboxylate transporter DctM subunit